MLSLIEKAPYFLLDFNFGQKQNLKLKPAGKEKYKNLRSIKIGMEQYLKCSIIHNFLSSTCVYSCDGVGGDGRGEDGLWNVCLQSQKDQINMWKDTWKSCGVE